MNHLPGTTTLAHKAVDGSSGAPDPRLRGAGRVRLLVTGVVLGLALRKAVLLVISKRRTGVDPVNAPTPQQPTTDCAPLRERSLPELNIMRNLPSIRFFSARRHKYLWAIGFSFFVVMLLGVFPTSLEGCLLSLSSAASIRKALPASLGLFDRVLQYVSRGGMVTGFLDEKGLMIVLFLLFPSFIVAEVRIYSHFGPTVAQLHTDRLHVQLAKTQSYLDAVKKYDRLFNLPVTNALALLMSLATMAGFVGGRSNACCWAGAPNYLSLCSLAVLGTLVPYHIFGIGTFKGWAAIRFCSEYFGSQDTVFELQPFHPDGFGGLGGVGQLLTGLYWITLFSGVGGFVMYRFSLFAVWTEYMLWIVVFGAICYPVFVTIPTFLIYRHAVKFRTNKLTLIGCRMTHLLRALASPQLSRPHMTKGRADYLAELEREGAHFNLYRHMPVLPFATRHVAFVVVYYVFQFAQVAILFL